MKICAIILIFFISLTLLFVSCQSSDDDDDDGLTDDDGDDDDNDNHQGIPIYANDENWTATGVDVSYGDTLIISAIGEARLEQGGDYVGPDGLDSSCGMDCPAPDLAKGALIGKIQSGAKSTGVPFAVGSDFKMLFTVAGSLVLMVNDDSYDDNSGVYYAEIELSAAGDDDDTGDDDDNGLPEQCMPRNFIQQVIDVQYGTTAGFGQPFFPDNVFGPPVGKGSFASQSSPAHLLSLGEGGSITVKMGRKIIDGEGIDFIVYDNVLWWGGDPANSYTEAAVVQASQDGTTWVDFPFDFIIEGPTGPHGVPDTVPENFIGFAGIIPTWANCDPDGDGDFSDMVDPLDPEAGGGDPFDLADVELDWVAYIRIIDTGHIIRNPGSEMYDGDGDLINDGGNLLEVYDGIQGFDLDAIAVVNGGEELSPDEI